MERILSLKAIVTNEAGKQADSGHATVYLFEDDSKTILPISVDASSAEAILLAQQNLISPRPHTHDLVKRLLNYFQAKLVDVVIYDLQDDIYYAYLRIMHEDTLLEIDTRPSDAIAMALRMAVPITARLDVIEKGGIKITENIFY